MSVGVFLNKLRNVKKNGQGWTALCPVHDDHTPSLSIAEDPDGRVKIYCHACQANGAAVAEALGIDKSELGAPGAASSNADRRYRLADADRRHPYRDEDGTLLYNVGMFRERDGAKTFRPFLPDGKQGYGDRRVLYRLDELTRSAGPVYLVEGEKDADRLRTLGLTATTNPMGAGKFSHCDTSALDGRDVIVIGDNDEPGRKHVADVVGRLEGRAASVRAVELPGLGDKGDVSDWLDAGGTVDDLEALVNNAGTDEAGRFDPGGVIFDTPAVPEALWGAGSEVLAAIGEPTILYSPTGIGKTTLAQRVILAAIGIGLPEVLGYPVRQIEGRVLYVAADRPTQAMRSLRRMVTPGDRATLDERLRWERQRRIRITPEHPEAVYEAAVEVGATVVVIDSVKDLVAKASSDEGGQAFNDAVQTCTANGVEVIALHHVRKATSEGRGALSLDDVYGSTWLTAGAGSVIALHGNAGDGVAKLRHLKTPAEEVGPFDVDFDYDAGTVTTIGRRDLAEWFAKVGTGTTAEATRHVLGKDDATEVEKRKVRRKLVRLEEDGYLTRNGEAGAMTVWQWIGAQTVTRPAPEDGQGGRSGVGQGGRSPTRSGPVTENGNVDAARAEGVGQGVGQGRSPGSVISPVSITQGMTTPAVKKEEETVSGGVATSPLPTCRHCGNTPKAIYQSGLCSDCEADRLAPF